MGGILIRALLISGFVIGMTIIAGIHPVIGTPENIEVQGRLQGQSDCSNGKNYNPNQGPNSGGNSIMYLGGYKNGWMDAGCVLPPPHNP